jgi:hypothetical protein
MRRATSAEAPCSSSCQTHQPPRAPGPRAAMRVRCPECRAGSAQQRRRTPTLAPSPAVLKQRGVCGACDDGTSRAQPGQLLDRQHIHARAHTHTHTHTATHTCSSCRTAVSRAPGCSCGASGTCSSTNTAQRTPAGPSSSSWLARLDATPMAVGASAAQRTQACGACAVRACVAGGAGRNAARTKLQHRKNTCTTSLRARRADSHSSRCRGSRPSPSSTCMGGPCMCDTPE